MIEPHDRLKLLRISAGYKTAADFARAHQIKPVTYRAHESGQNRLTAETAAVYARIYGVTIDSILTGEGFAMGGALVSPQALPPPPAVERPKPNGTTPISELDVRAQGGAGFNHEPNGPEPVVAEWRMSTVMLRGQTTAAPEQIKIITVYGDSMVPDFLPGERVLVDLSDQTPSPPGVFVVWDGFGLVIKRLEMVPYSNPPTVKLKSANEAYDTYERALAEVVINGRVIGKWKWT